MAVIIDKSVCTGCGECIPTCPVEALSLVNNISVVDESTCADCGACIDVCPVSAISM